MARNYSTSKHISSYYWKHMPHTTALKSIQHLSKINVGCLYHSTVSSTTHVFVYQSSHVCLSHAHVDKMNTINICSKYLLKTLNNTCKYTIIDYYELVQRETYLQEVDPELHVEKELTGQILFRIQELCLIC